MHLSDALLSVPVAAAGIACTAAALGTAAKRAEQTSGREAMEMGIWGAFVFAAQMLNVAIPGTGASGHLIGAVLLSCLFGPWRALITMSAVLIIQAFLFADGGVLALGWNIFNMGIIPCLLIFPFLLKPFGRHERGWSTPVVVAGALLATELAAFAAVVEVHFSQMLHLPFGRFLGLMMGIHLPVGILEGLVTAWVLTLVRSFSAEHRDVASAIPVSRPLSLLVLITAGILSGWISWYASVHPDGLEWSLESTAVTGEVADNMSTIGGGETASDRNHWAPFPDYAIRSEEDGRQNAGSLMSIPGLVGTGAVLFLAVVAGAVIGRKRSLSNVEGEHG